MLPSGEVICVCRDVPTVNNQIVQQRPSDPTSRGRVPQPHRVREQ
jgi:hypothetical protein